jgi:spore maturation protein SpmA
VLNRLWFGFFLVAAVAALSRWLIGGDETVFTAVVGSLFDMADLSVKVMLLLFGWAFSISPRTPAWSSAPRACWGRCFRG